MTSVNNQQISTKDNLIISSAAGILGGSSLALCGYYSRPYLKDGELSDEFVKNVEKNLAAKLPGGKENQKLIKHFNNFIEEMGKAKTYSQMAEINFNYLRKISPDKSFEGIKNLVKQYLEFEMRLLAQPNNYATDVLLDYFSAIIKSKNITQLKAATCEYFAEIGSYQESFADVRAALKEEFESNKNSKLGLDPELSLKETAEELFDWKTGKFVPDKEGYIPKNIYTAVKETAKNMQRKTAGLWGGIAAAVFGGTMFLIQKFSRPKIKQVLPQAALKKDTLQTSQPLIKPQTRQFSELSKLIKEQNHAKA